MVVARLDEIEGNEHAFEITGRSFSPFHGAASNPFWNKVAFK